MATVRRNQHDLSNSQHAAFVAAVNKLHGTVAPAPAYRVFVQVHVDAMSMAGMSWGVHTMAGMGVVGGNFLSWHRRFLRQFEQRLQAIDPAVAVPYWDWIADPDPPGFLSDEVSKILAAPGSVRARQTSSPNTVRAWRNRHGRRGQGVRERGYHRQRLLTGRRGHRYVGHDLRAVLAVNRGAEGGDVQEISSTGSRWAGPRLRRTSPRLCRTWPGRIRTI